VNGPASGPGGLAFKAKEIEELADVYFFRPLGMVFARLARAVGLSPTAVTLIGTAVGITGGVLLSSPSWAFTGFLVIVFHSVLDSSDGQLARMTGTSSEFGRMMDGIGGYLTHIAIYGGILSTVWGSVAFGPTLLWAIAAACSNVVHAQMYDYHRSTYESVVVKGRVTERGRAALSTIHDRPGTLTARVMARYEGMERALAGPHAAVEAALARRNPHTVADADRARYRRSFYWLVRGWNFLGDNTRFYAIGVVAWFHHVTWFFPAVLLMNIALVALWWTQARTDRQFLRAL
jgi:phosphatidylglycerophosphate synthase